MSVGSRFPTHVPKDEKAALCGQLERGILDRHPNPLRPLRILQHGDGFI
jgi:hypothetical protein